MKMSNLKGRPSPALVVSLIALFVALGGGAYAAKKIGSNQIKNNAISAKKLKNNAVTTKKLKNKSVGTNKLQDLSVNSDKLQDNAVGTDKIADVAVTNQKLKNKSVGTNKLKDASVNADKLQDNAVGTDKVTDGAVTSEKVSPDIPYRHMLESTFTAGAGYESLVTFGDAELQARCNTAGANGSIQLRVISVNDGAQADMTATGPGGVPQFANSGLLGPNVGVEITAVALGNFNSPGVGSARVAARAPDGTALLATVGTHSLGGGACAINALAL
jgi:hypothetical protein